MVGMSIQFPIDIAGIATGASVIAVIGTTLFVTKDADIDSKVIFLFSAVIGMIIANGLLFQAIIFSIFIIFIKKYSNTILDSLKIEQEEENN